MMEKLNEAYEELKRVDHLVYVSLKYTRTVDVIINILNRMIDSYALMVDALILYATEQGKIIQEPESSIERAVLIKQLFSSDELVVDNMELYLLLRKLIRAKTFERENEYRRHVTMKTIIEGREEIVNIDIITNYFLYQREFLTHTRNVIEGKVVTTPTRQEMTPQDAPQWMTERPEAKMDLEESKPRSEPSRMVPNTQPKSRSSTANKKRAPRPKKYKIQIPKGKNPILRAPYQPPVRKEVVVEKKQQKTVKKKVTKPKKVTKKPTKKATTKKKR